jgi:hypothetical protein
MNAEILQQCREVNVQVKKRGVGLPYNCSLGGRFTKLKGWEQTDSLLIKCAGRCGTYSFVSQF